jgi:hypothetical protein
VSYNLLSTLCGLAFIASMYALGRGNIAMGMIIPIALWGAVAFSAASRKNKQ